MIGGDPTKNMKNTRRNHEGKHERITQTNKIWSHISYILKTQRVIHGSKSTKDDRKVLVRVEVLRGLPMKGS